MVALLVGSLPVPTSPSPGVCVWGWGFIRPPSLLYVITTVFCLDGLSYSLTLSLSLSPSLLLFLSLFLSLSHPPSLSFSLYLCLSLPPSLSCSLFFSLFLSLSLPPSLSCSLSFSLPPSLSHSLALSPFGRYYTQCMFQHTGQELADNLKVCMTGALQNYHTVNGYMPERIIVYRDGVGDGQVSTLPTVKFSDRRNHFFLLFKKICSLPFPCLCYSLTTESVKWWVRQLSMRWYIGGIPVQQLMCIMLLELFPVSSPSLM